LASNAADGPGNRRARFHTAAGSASEVRSALQVAVAWGYIAQERAKEADALVDRLLAMLFKLKRG
jgi:four helix bundle protein